MCGENIGVVDRMGTGVDCCNLIEEIVEADILLLNRGCGLCANFRVRRFSLGVSPVLPL